MKFLAFYFVCLSFNALAQVNQKIQGKWAYYGEEFYKTLLSSRGSNDRSVFNKIFNENHSSALGKFDVINTQCLAGSKCYRHTSVGYERARQIMFGELDILKDEKGTYVRDVYCGKKFYFQNLEEVSRMHERVNIEHTWPQSKFNGNFPKDLQKSDMHHLYLADSKANAVRGNTPFGFLDSKLDNRMGADGCGQSMLGFINQEQVYTPPPHHRGNVARSLFYFSMHYNLGIGRAEELILRQWHKSDPVDEAEVSRHEAIARYQNVRNPFIDHPELVEKITDF
jgi:deoxyribonuclease-1